MEKKYKYYFDGVLYFILLEPKDVRLFESRYGVMLIEQT